MITSGNRHSLPIDAVPCETSGLEGNVTFFLLIIVVNVLVSIDEWPSYT